MQAMQETWGYLRIMLRILAAESLVLAVSSAVLLETTELWVTVSTCKHLKTFLLLTLQHWAVRRPRSNPCVPCHHGLRYRVIVCRQREKDYLTSANLSMKSHRYSLPCQQLHRVSMRDLYFLSYSSTTYVSSTDTVG